MSNPLRESPIVPADRIGELLRSEVSTLFTVHQCVIDISVNPDLWTAQYTYNYTIAKKEPGPDKWRFVIGYPPAEVEMNGAEDEYGTHLHVPPKAPLTGAPTNTEVWVTLGKSLEVGEPYSFKFKCSTRIEGLPPPSRLGGFGSVWFWITHEYHCKLIRVAFTLPKPLRARSTDPIALIRTSPLTCTFEQKELLPRQFFLVLITYEKRFWGLRPEFAGALGNLIWLVIGAILSLLLSLLILGRP